MVNPVQPMAAAFLNIWNLLPVPFVRLFYISLLLAFILWLLNKLSS